MNKIQHSFKEIRIIKGETRTEEFKKVNPLMKVPAIEELD
jgi:glutathione S-transferase